MRHHHESAAPASRDVEKQLGNGVPSCAIECARRLVRQQDGRLIDQGACHGSALTLTTRKLTGRNTVAGNTKVTEKALGPLIGLSGRHPTQQGRESHVFHRCQFRQKLAELEHHTHVTAAVTLQGTLPHPDNILTRYLNSPLRRPYQSQDATEQRALPAAAGADDGCRLTRCDLQIQSSQQYAISYRVVKPTDTQYTLVNTCTVALPHWSLHFPLTAQAGRAAYNAVPTLPFSPATTARPTGCAVHGENQPRISQRPHSSSLSFTHVQARKSVTRPPVPLYVMLRGPPLFHSV